MVMSTGTIRPSLACAWVAALKSLQNPMMFTPCWPSAGPTGGEGFAFPAGSWSLMYALIFFFAAAMGLLPFLHVAEFELDRRRPAEDGNHHLQLLLVGLHFL